MKNTTRPTGKKVAKSEPRLSRLHPPTDMAPEAWQTALRRKYGREQNCALENIGTEPVFSEFRVTNATSRGHYRIAIRGSGARDNYCSCPDYATNELGTCKHIEFTLAKLEKKRGGRAALKQGYQSPFSEIYLRYGSRRSLHFRAGGNCPASLRSAASRLFDEHAGWTLAPEHFSRL